MARFKLTESLGCEEESQLGIQEYTLEESNIDTYTQLEKLTFLSILETIPSGIAFDIAPGHTGIVMWTGSEVKTFGFTTELRYNKDVEFSEAKMRRWFYNKIKPLVEGMHFEYCGVEDVYFGENPKTVRELLALNTVIDDLILDGVFTVKHLYRDLILEWLARFRKFCKIPNLPTTKFEIQSILKHLEFDFYLKNESLSDTEKEKIYFEDICDAAGILCSIVALVNLNLTKKTKPQIQLSDMVFKFAQSESELSSLYIKDYVISNFSSKLVQLNRRKNIESAILDVINTDNARVYIAEVQVGHLGHFGVKHGIVGNLEDITYLIFYNKSLNKL